MLYLSNELYKQKGKHVQFIVGDPISPEELKENKNDRNLAQEIKNKTYNLRNQL